MKTQLLVVLTTLLVGACTADRPATVAAEGEAGLVCSDGMTLNVDPSGEEPGYPDPEAAMRALSEDQGLDTTGWTLSFREGTSNARGVWRTAAGEQVAEVLAEPLYDQGWYGTGLSTCVPVADPEDG